MDFCKRLLWSVVCLAAVFPATAATWYEDIETAKSQAASLRRPILLYFTGSDWCPYCIQFRGNVLDTGTFQNYADSKLVLFIADFPRRRAVPPVQLQANRQLSAQYGVSGFPTAILATPSGQLVANLPTTRNPADFIKSIDPYLASASSAAGSPSGAAGRRKGPTAPVQEVPMFGGAQTHPPTAYSNLLLKSISGTATRRFALINSETMRAGDSARFKLGDATVNVQCVEVREKSVLIRVQGESAPRELKMAPLVLRPQLTRKD